MNDATMKDWRLFGIYRLILALLVLTSHSNMFLPTWVAPLALGNVGVFCFFVLSGFVISEACDRFYRGAPHRFLANRFLRLYPTYWAACAVAVGLYLYLEDPRLAFTSATIAPNLGIIYVPPGIFLWVSVIWAVGIELRYYLVAAAVSFAAHRFPAHTTLVYGIAGAGALAVYGISYLSDFGVLGTFKHAPFFVFGAATYFTITGRSMKATVLMWCAALLSVHSYWIYNSTGPTDLASSTALYISVALIMMLLAKASDSSRKLVQLDKFFGDFTYPLYLVHLPIVLLIDRLAPNKSSMYYLVILLLSFAVSGLLILLIEYPLLTLRDMIRRRSLYS